MENDLSKLERECTYFETKSTLTSAHMAKVEKVCVKFRNDTPPTSTAGKSRLRGFKTLLLAIHKELGVEFFWLFVFAFTATELGTLKAPKLIEAIKIRWNHKEVPAHLVKVCPNLFGRCSDIPELEGMNDF